MDSAFLGLFSTSCGPSFSGHGYPTQSAANTSCPRSDRFWLRELRVSQQISTFYGPSVQAMDTQLGAAATVDPDDPPRPCSTNNARNRPRLEGEVVRHGRKPLKTPAGFSEQPRVSGRSRVTAGCEGQARRYATRHHPRTLDPDESERPWTLSSAVAGSRYSPWASM